jgi:hypothetical protein
MRSLARWLARVLLISLFSVPLLSGSLRVVPSRLLPLFLLFSALPRFLSHGRARREGKRRRSSRRRHCVRAEVLGARLGVAALRRTGCGFCVRRRCAIAATVRNRILPPGEVVAEEPDCVSACVSACNCREVARAMRLCMENIRVHSTCRLAYDARCGFALTTFLQHRIIPKSLPLACGPALE